MTIQHEERFIAWREINIEGVPLLVLKRQTIDSWGSQQNRMSLLDGRVSDIVLEHII